ncbi:MAG: hypothetical protein KDK62_08090 [Chlamydiia bacterium]|nr:hypothetical protein [Chlamydiia bacterium]
MNNRVESSGSNPQVFPFEDPKKPTWLSKKITLLTSSESIDPFLRGVGYTLASKFASVFVPSKAPMFRIKATMAWEDLRPIWAKHYFGEDHYEGTAKNIAKVDVLETEADFNEAISILQRMQALPEELIQQVEVDPSVMPNKMSTMGICAGIQLDIARRYLGKGKDIDQIIRTGEEGASKKAAASQAVFELLNPVEEDRALVIGRTLEAIKRGRDKAEPGSIYSVDSDIVTNLFDECNKDPNLIKELRQVFDKRSQTKTIASHLKNKKELLKKKTGSLTEFEALLRNSSDEEIEWVGGFLEHQFGSQKYKENERLRNLPGFWSALRNAAIEIFGLRESQEELAFGRFTNIEVAHAIVGERYSRGYRTRANVVLAVTGLELKEVDRKVGFYFQHSNDRDFLKNFKDLEPGIYGIIFETDEGGHAITFIKEADGTDWILDPNGMQLKSNDPESTTLLFQKVLSLYDYPLHDPNRHEIVVSRVVKRS